MGKILIGEDFADTRNMFQRYAEHHGIGGDLLLAIDGKEALEKLGEQGERISRVVLDIHMPHVDGFEVAKTLRANGHQAELVLMSTGPLCPDDKAILADLGGSYVEKPFGDGVIENILGIR